MPERDVVAAIQLDLSRGDTRLLRINAGEAWAGRVVSRTPRLLVLEDYHHVMLAAEGISDLIGWTGPLCTFTAIEAKYGRRRATEAQQAFIDLVLASGGRAGVARSVDDARRILRGA